MQAEIEKLKQKPKPRNKLMIDRLERIESLIFIALADCKNSTDPDLVYLTEMIEDARHTIRAAKEHLE